MHRITPAFQIVSHLLQRLAGAPRQMIGIALTLVAFSGLLTAAVALAAEGSVSPSALSSSKEGSNVDASPALSPATGSSSATSTTSDDGSSNNSDNPRTPTAAEASSSSAADATATPTNADPHNNGNGCDDIIHADGRTPGPGGPIGCSVGNSGDHRQNGANTTNTTPTPTAAATDAATDTPTAAPTGTATDPHDNGHGCDDVNPAVTDGQPSHGGPVDCTVGNSGDHRQNGNHGSATPETTPAAASTAGATSPTGPGNSGEHGGKKPR